MKKRIGHFEILGFHIGVVHKVDRGFHWCGT